MRRHRHPEGSRPGGERRGEDDARVGAAPTPAAREPGGRATRAVAVLAAQRAYGNHAVSRALARAPPARARRH
ncbi:hypothetical protein [Miltoncostaea marina]|uniref:hypothetical protein n=1 Tax=Miltoncostaea marina TaxID=2843215 RepID=UPI001C3E3DFD|nr:hypothetical protein [Miltoncostaea marina]